MITIYRSARGDYTVSENRMWLAGVYDTEETARRAVSFPDYVLEVALAPIYRIDGENRPVSGADLDRAANRLSQDACGCRRYDQTVYRLCGVHTPEETLRADSSTPG